MKNLKEIMEREDFSRELKRATLISYENNSESGFCVWTDDTYTNYNVNQSIVGKKESIYTDMSQLKKHETGKGFYVPLCCYKAISIHFHPPNSNIKPSIGDIKEYFASLETNKNLGDSNGEHEKSVFKKDRWGEQEVIGEKIEYVVPVHLIGMVRNNPKNYELLIYQATSVNSQLNRFFQFIIDYINKESGVEFTIDMLHLLGGIPVGFWSPKRVVNLLNMSNQFYAETIKIHNNGISKTNLEKLTEFNFILTKFLRY